MHSPPRPRHLRLVAGEHRRADPPPARAAPPPRSVSGVVVAAESGEPIAGAVVAWVPAVGRLAPRPARGAATDRRGRFALPAARGSLLLLVGAPGRLPDVAGVPGDEHDVSVALAAAGALTGAVTTADGTSLAGARVRALSRDAMDVAECVADAAGRFAIAGLRPGRYEVACAAAPGGTGPARVDVRAGATAHVTVLVPLAPRDADPAPTANIRR